MQMNKPMSLLARQEMLTIINPKYKAGNSKIKKQLLDGLIAATGYERKYALKLLNNKLPINNNIIKKGKPVYYDKAVVQVLEMIWHASNQICSKRLVPFLSDFVTALENHGHLKISDEIRTRVLSVSPATFDRLLRKERIKEKGGISTTKPGSLLKNQIKVRTFADWNEKQPGFFEADLVAHCGEVVSGTFLNTLVMTDIITTWTECIPLLRKSADDVILGLDTARKLLPFKVLGFDVDNGCEFINYDMLDYCEQNNITFTRSRAYRKNDQAHVEQKNGSIVRRLIGYDRYENELAWEAMSQLYSVLRLYVNFFQPSLKLIKKIRQNSKTIKKYEKAKTPYQRVICSEHISQIIKDELTKQYDNLDPIALLDKIKQLQDKLWKLAWNKPIQTVKEKTDIENNTNLIKPISSEQRFYHKTKKASSKHNWKTRKDPFEKVQEFIDLELKFKPNMAAVELLDKLIQKYPNDFYKGHLRTLQRRIKDIRTEQRYREKKYQELMINKKLMTTKSFGRNIS